MMERHRASASELVKAMGLTPVDRSVNYRTNVPWKSNAAYDQLKAYFHYRDLLSAVGSNPMIYGPLAYAANWQKELLDIFVTGPMKNNVKNAVRKGTNLDIYSEGNARVYARYGELLYELTDRFITDGRFDRQRAFAAATTSRGQKMLRGYIGRFQDLEYDYNVTGLSRLKAMKELLKSLLITITESPIGDDVLPFSPIQNNIDSPQTFLAYLEESRRRLENLHRMKAFDIKAFSEAATGGKIGCCPHETVAGSNLHSVSLRRYLTPPGVKKNGRILYLATPLINKPELFDLAKDKSVVEGLLYMGYDIYLVDYGDPGARESGLGLDFYGGTVHETYLDMISAMNPGREICAMGYCMGGTLLLPYLARRAEERLISGRAMDIRKIVLMACPVQFDDGASGQGPMRSFIRKRYDPLVMENLFGDVNVPPQVIQAGMNEIQPGIHYTVPIGFYGRASYPGAVEDAAPFLYWLTHGTKFPARAHREWLAHIFLDNRIAEERYCLPSSNPALNGKAVNMGSLREAGVCIFDYRGSRDPIAPPGSCVASQKWGLREGGNLSISTNGLNRTIEKNIGHIFVVSKKLLGEFLAAASRFLEG